MNIIPNEQKHILHVQTPGVNPGGDVFLWRGRGGQARRDSFW
jgi:hypothetical protein